MVVREGNEGARLPDPLAQRHFRHQVGDRAGEFHIEIDDLVVGPGMRATVALHGIFAHLPDLRAQQPVARHQVDHQLGRLSDGIGVAMRRDALAHRQFGIDIPAVEMDLVVTGDGGFTVVGKRRTVIRFRNRPCQTLDGHYPNVAQIGAARSAQVGVAEAQDQRIAVMIAGTAVPVVLAGIGTELDHAEWIGGAGEGMSVEVSSDKGIDQVGILCAEHTRREQARKACQQDEENQKLFHNCKNTYFFINFTE